ncbi:MAG: carbohydrate kinase [Planctomycetota bacterium]|nr:MAG: carbohydrate kinase [Planctomycetota bacterium]REJ95389.1 MAG: carbohydrate kinase [Planctomycetota bacterium]REK17589.1 MAG: carbohydrate kinase [Planctomycetota bacterium]REK39820.1 MAG: carbohydrate kinase [Planctomycetota bacterium]
MTNRPLVIGAGELLWDCFPDGRRPGGAPANVAFHAQQLGLQGVIYSRVGRDQWGNELSAFLGERGLTTQYIQRDAEHETGRVTVDLSDRDHPAFTIHEDGAWDYLALDEPTRQLAGKAAAICFGTLAQRNKPSREALHGLLRAAPPECRIVYDVNFRPPWLNRDWLEKSLRAADVVKLNDDEAGLVSALLELGVAELAALARRLIDDFDVALVCVTRGENGCLLVSKTEQVVAAGIPVRCVDPVGAGDAFTAALIFAQLRKWPLRSTAEFANQVGALVATHQGAMPKLSSEFSGLIKQFE